MRTELGNGAWVELVEGFVADHTALMARLLETLPLEQANIKLFGRDVAMPRLTSWHGDEGRAYSFSGKAFTPHAWTAELATLRDRLPGLFNSVLANYYRNGRDSVSAHSDDEPELGPTKDNVLIASVSLGATRRFVLKNKTTGEVRTFELGAGSLLIMGGTTQTHWTHAVPKTSKPVGPRLNLTFRVIV